MTDHIPLTDDERALLNHLMMWGSAGYPINRVGRKWTWGPFRSIRGLPTCVKTKREAVESFEAYYAILRARYAEERYAAAMAEQVNP